MGLWQAHDAGGAAAQAPAVAGKDAAGARPRAHEVGESGEEADSGDQEEREGGADGGGEDPGEGFGAHEEIRGEVL